MVKKKADNKKKGKIKKIKIFASPLFWAFFVFLLAIVLILIANVYFKNLIERERTVAISDFLKERLSEERAREIIEEIETTGDMIRRAEREEGEVIAPVSPSQPKDLRIERFFLSEVRLVGEYYLSTIYTCLRENEAAYPSYIWTSWSRLDYPDPQHIQGSTPEISLARFLLLPEDNKGFQPDRNCYIKEIITDSDWAEVESKYNFSRSRF